MLRREPFRLFFPLGALIGLAGVLPWVLFGAGRLARWPGMEHALSMSEGFLPAIAAGFLGTMVPRRTRGAEMGWIELLAIALGLLLVPVAAWLGSIEVAQIGYVVAVGALATFAIRRFRARPADAPGPPPSLAVLPFAVLLGVGGAVALAVGRVGTGRALVGDGVLTALVVALAPMLTPILAHGRGRELPSSRWAFASWAGLGALLAAGFALSELGLERTGALLRGGAALVAVVRAGALRWPTAAGLHRRLFVIALWLVPVGALLRAAWPGWRLPLEHVGFVGGISLLVFAVSAHVTMLHTGRERVAAGRPWPLGVVAVLTLAAAGVRVGAERSGDYPLALLVAAGLWLGAAATWAAFLAPMLARRGVEGNAGIHR